MAPVSILDITVKPLAERVANPAVSGAWQGGLTPGGVDLIAMIVSDSGLASTQPQWWNSSIKGCVFIGLQPRGGWQVMQRAVQWGNDSIASVFGVTCSKPSRYAYFACTIRNRLEMWDSPAWSSPTEGLKEPKGWNDVGQSHVRRPTKLIDGSRGGQAFICDLLLPQKDTPYTIEAQARMQFRSILLVAAGLMNPDGLERLDEVMQEDFQLSYKLGVVFRPLLIALIVVNVLVIFLSIASVFSIFSRNIFGVLVPFVVQAASLLLWAVGATGLLMLGGNPRVKLTSLSDSNMPLHILKRLATLETTKNKEDMVDIRFGSIHGSGYTADHGYCSLPFDIADRICRWEVVAVRPRSWAIGMGWWGICLLFSIALQIMGAQVATVWSEIFSVIVLLMTALTRGYGVAGPEEWLIPSWKRRPTAGYGASLLGKTEARTDG
ncbi:hypothetical protein GALMADRAFT_1293165 [Galerina marginata CBS 339.88]|uniref:Uncharacterized protein n=1 Tax=Galerina marginata (strain CBS 339.88) TaxID=685588 RepID=A0A067TDC7_GALM3|nr:hypothetical protein GALMADRAFT_1293165 [Galerina marginata CBS 339.88]